MCAFAANSVGMEQGSQYKSPPPGWSLQDRFLETFAGRAGPYYFRDPGGPPGVGFYAGPEHANGGGKVHGGALMTLADMSLWDICIRKTGPLKAVTVTLNSEFLGPAEIGSFVEATGELTREGKQLLFARGLITCEGKNVMAFSGMLKRFS